MSLAMHPNDSRAFHAAVLFSIVLHGLLLFAIPRYEPSFQPAAEAPPLVARLVEPAAPPVAADPTPPAPQPQPQPQQRRKPKPMAKSLPEAPASPAPIQPPSEEPARAEPAISAQQPPAVEEQPQANAAQPRSEPPPAQEAPVAPPFDPAALSKYRLEVISLARQFKRYPPLARENGWEGRAEVRLNFDADGKRPSVELLKSSGYPVLDRQAVDTLAKARAPLPPALRGRQFALDIPVIFNLDD